MNVTDLSSSRVARPILLIAGILLIAAVLRAPITGLAPVLGLVRDTTGLTAPEAGILTTLPLVAFAVVSPFAALVARDYGLERTIFGALVLIGAGIALRSLSPVWSLFLGTAVLGAGIAFANVLLPSLIKRDFPAKMGELTGAYAMSAGLVAAAASVVAVPLAEGLGLGWQGALAAMLVFVLVAMLVWVPQLGGRTMPDRATASAPHGGKVWHSALAWQVTFFMGSVSLLYYVTIGWLPTILTDAGFTPEKAGSIHAVTQLASAAPGFVVAPLMGRMRDQRGLALAFAGLVAVSLLGLWQLPALAAIWAAVFGFGAGAAFILAISFVGLRAATAARAAALSGMAQCVGYSLAAVGPPLAGYLHDLGGGWGPTFALTLAATASMAVFGVLAGRSRVI